METTAEIKRKKGIPGENPPKMNISGTITNRPRKNIQTNWLMRRYFSRKNPTIKNSIIPADRNAILPIPPIIISGSFQFNIQLQGHEKLGVQKQGERLF